MNGYEMKFGDAVGPKSYHSLKVIFQNKQGSDIGGFGPTRQPFPGYAVGHQIEIGDELRNIISVLHRVVPKPPPEDWVLVTTVIVD